MAYDSLDTHHSHSTDSYEPNLRLKPAPLSRRDWVRLTSGASAILAGLAALGARAGGGVATRSVMITMYAPEACECCHKWADHLTTAGFTVKKHVLRDVSAKKDALLVPTALRSCHTAEADGYVFEGHVPPKLIMRFLTDRPADRGLAVPGMPGGSPGMEDSSKQAYEVLAFHPNGSTRIYAHVA